MWRCVFLWINVGTAVLGCEWLVHFNERTHDCLKKLRKMEGAPDVYFHGPGRGFNRLYKCIKCQNKASQLAFIQENLKHIHDLYHYGNLSRLNWDVKPFLSSLDSQMLRLQPCVSVNAGEDSAVSRYYRQLLDKTHRMNGTLATWKQINQITKLHLHRLDRLVGSLRQAPSRGRHSRETATRRSMGRRTTPKLTARGCCKA